MALPSHSLSTRQQNGFDMMNEKLDETAVALEHTVEDYLEWMAVNGYTQSTQQSYKQMLSQFLSFVRSGGYPWDEIFTLHMLKHFKKNRGLTRAYAVTGLSRYLYGQGKIADPIRVRKALPPLPVIYEDYLLYQKKYRQTPDQPIKHIRRVLCAFEHYLKQHHIKPRALRIEQIDAFRAEFFKGFSGATCRVYRGHLRQFLRYLYHERRILIRDLAPLVVGRRKYANAKPPKFLRPAEVQKLFAGLSACSASDIRTYAMVHLAYTMGLRPKEISKIRLNDVFFSQQLLSLPVRKGDNPIELPVPAHTVKAVAAYIIGARPQSEKRTLFLTLHPPQRPMSPNTVGQHISKAMRKAGLNATAYWLRHTYAQNLLEAGASIFEIKEMLGHDKIESTKLYLHVHTKLMRKVLFDETL
jgi:integrase/recombinase XerD